MTTSTAASVKPAKQVKRPAKKFGSSAIQYGRVYLRNLKEGPNPGHFD